MAQTASIILRLILWAAWQTIPRRFEGQVAKMEASTSVQVELAARIIQLKNYAVSSVLKIIIGRRTGLQLVLVCFNQIRISTFLTIIRPNHLLENKILFSFGWGNKRKILDTHGQKRIGGADGAKKDWWRRGADGATQEHSTYMIVHDVALLDWSLDDSDYNIQ